MAELKGLIGFEGTLGGITAYNLNGKPVLRQCRSKEKNKIAEGANYQRTRENNTEFSGAITASKVFRHTLKSVSRGYADPHFTGRLQGEYTKMIHLSAGIRGQRVFKPREHAAAFLNIAFNKNWSLDCALRIKPDITVNAERTAATLSMSLDPVTDLFYPAGATHIELIYAIAVQPAFEYDARSKTYMRTDELNQHYMQTVSSELLPLTSDEVFDISLPAPALELPALHADSALVSVLGVCYHQQVGFKTYPLKMGKAMGFVAVS